MYHNLLYEKDGEVAVITINRPKAYNAMNEETIDELNDVLDQVNADAQIRAVVVTGGKKVFVAGGDIRFMAEATSLAAESFIEKCHKALEKITASDKPFIAAVSGMALGGGCELMLACDVRISSQTAILGFPEINLGIFPGSGGTQRLANLVGEGWAKYLIFSGENISAEKAKEIGLVQFVTKEDDVLEEAMKMARLFASKGKYAMASAKRCIHFSKNGELAAGLAFERKAWSMLFDTQDQKEGMHAFLEKRSPKFES